MGRETGRNSIFRPDSGCHEVNALCEDDLSCFLDRRARFVFAVRFFQWKAVAACHVIGCFLATGR